MSKAEWKKMPDQEGWYFTGQKRDRSARWDGQWTYVFMVSEEEGQLKKACFFSDACDGLVSIPLSPYQRARWFGPVQIDEES